MVGYRRGPLAHRYRLPRPFQGRRAGGSHAIKFASYRLENERRTPPRLLGRLRRGSRWLVTSGCLRSSDWAAPPACACYVVLCGADGAQAQQRLDGTASPRWLCGTGDAQARQRGIRCRACANALPRGRLPVALLELARLSAARKADGQADGGGDDPAQA